MRGFALKCHGNRTENGLPLNHENNQQLHAPAVYLPAGTYKITSTLTWSNVTGAAIIGTGRTTIISWYGSADGNMFLSNGGTRCRYIGLTWDGRNIAGDGFYHHSASLYESRCRHEHEKFLNMTSAGLRSHGGGGGGFQACSESFIWNCMFYNCAKGFWNGSDMYNSYDWMVQSSQFENCGTAVYSTMGKATVLECHFQGSTTQDFYTWGNIPLWVRRCTSAGSKQFFVSTIGGGLTGTVIENCRVTSWTTAPAMNFGTRGTAVVYDCKFTNPPNTTPPILLNASGSNTMVLVHSNNIYPGCSALYSSSGLSTVHSVPDGNVDTILGNDPNYVFLRSSVTAEGPVLDVKASPYNAVGNGIANDTTPIQNAINDARTLGGNRVVYIPKGDYKITSSLNVYGSNYRIQGAGLNTSRLTWAGTSGGILMTVSNPSNIRIEQLEFNTTPAEAAIRQTGTTSCNIVYDGVYNKTNGNYNTTGRGLEMIDLPANSRVFLQHLDAPLTIDDCGRADILGRFVLDGRWIIKGADYPKVGFFGVDLGQGGVYTDGPSYWDIDIQDNQDAVIGLYYNENQFRHVRLQRGLSTRPGRFTMGGYKQHSMTSPEFLNIDNYQGRVMYGPQWSNSAVLNTITHTGTNLVDLILLGLAFDSTQDVVPTVTTGAGANRITINCASVNAGSGNRTAMATQTPAGWDTSIAASLDHWRDLGNSALRNNYGFAVSSGARAQWRLDQTSWNGTANEVVDSSLYANHGTAGGGTTTSSDAHLNRAGIFDGVDDIVTTSYTGTGLTGVTVSAWIKRTDAAADYRIIVGSNTNHNFEMWVNSGQVQFALGNFSDGQGAIRDAGAVPLNTWTHVAVTWSATKGFAAYVNKALTRTVGTNVTSITWPSMTIGKDYTANSGWAGLIDEVCVWTSPLTPAEIASLQ